MFENTKSARDLTSADWRLIVVARHGMNQRMATRLNAHLSIVAPEFVGTEKPQAAAAVEKLVKSLMFDRTAEYLACAQEGASPFSPAFVDALWLSKGEGIAQTIGVDVDSDEMAVLKKGLSSALSTFGKAAEDLLPKNTTLYSENYAWADALLQLSVERDLSPVVLLSDPSVYDEITRRTRTKDESMEVFRKANAKFMDADYLLQLAIDTAASMMLEMDDTDARRELVEGMEQEIKPYLEKYVAVCRPFVEACAKEDIDRIYGSE